jgi:hypothetical protein
LAHIIKRYYADDSKNSFSETIVCDLFLPEKSIYLYKVPCLVTSGGADNYFYQTPSPSTNNVDKSKYDSRRLNCKLSNGDTVVVQFIDSDIHKPFITGYLGHFQSGPQGKCPSPRGKKSEGVISKLRNQGMNFIIDKDGNVLFENTDTIDESIPKAKKFTINLIGDNAQSVVVDSISGNTTITSKNGTGTNTVVMATDGLKLQDCNGNKIVMDSSGILIQDKSGNKQTMASSGIITEDKTGNKVTMEAADIKIHSVAKAVKIDGSIYNNHVHIGNLGIATDMPLDRNTD